MKFLIVSAASFAALAVAIVNVYAAEAEWVSYEPEVVSLTGKIVETKVSGEGVAPTDRGKTVWILHLDHPISVHGKPGDDIDMEEKNVTEVHLALQKPSNLTKKDFAKVMARGTLFHAHTWHHQRPIVMLVTELKPAGSN